MKLHKTDRRFDLHRYGFDCYVEFDINDWHGYNRYKKHCRNVIGPEFWHLNKHVYTIDAGQWRSVACHQSRSWRSKRIYFRGKELYTMLLLTIPQDDENTETYHI